MMAWIVWAGEGEVEEDLVIDAVSRVKDDPMADPSDGLQ